MSETKLTKEEIEEFFSGAFQGASLKIVSVASRRAVIRRTPQDYDLRPGGTVSGPFMFMMADAAIYAAIFAELGPLALAVTTNLNINFLKKPAANTDVIAECDLIKVGKQLVVGEVRLFSEGQVEPIAHAVGTYSIPPEK